MILVRTSLPEYQIRNGFCGEHSTRRLGGERRRMISVDEHDVGLNLGGSQGAPELCQ
jgi:hypothetical protein